MSSSPKMREWWDEALWIAFNSPDLDPKPDAATTLVDVAMDVKCSRWPSGWHHLHFFDDGRVQCLCGIQVRRPALVSQQESDMNADAQPSIADRIASEIMDTIERERRVNKDDLILAVERVMFADKRALDATLVQLQDAAAYQSFPGFLYTKKRDELKRAHDAADDGIKPIDAGPLGQQLGELRRVIDDARRALYAGGEQKGCEQKKEASEAAKRAYLGGADGKTQPLAGSLAGAGIGSMIGAKTYIAWGGKIAEGEPVYRWDESDDHNAHHNGAGDIINKWRITRDEDGGTRLTLADNGTGSVAPIHPCSIRADGLHNFDEIGLASVHCRCGAHKAKD